MKVIQIQKFENVIWTDFDNGKTVKTLVQKDGSHVHTYFDANGQEMAKEEFWRR
jgi:hypothetical protein